MAESLYDLYYAVFNDKSRGFWNITASFPRYGTLDSKEFFESLFKPSLDNNNSGNAYHFIFEFFESIGKESVFWYLKDTQTQLSMLDSNHTLSALLLGMVVKDKLGIKIQNLPTTYDDEEQNFAYYWTLTCICHDIARQIEEESIVSFKRGHDFKYITSIQDFYKAFFIEEDDEQFTTVLKNQRGFSKKADLITNYFRFRLKTAESNDARMDHGIAGAILFYAAMMKDFKKAKDKGTHNQDKSIYYCGRRFAPEYEKNILFIAETIAEHNMWVPTTPTARKLYRCFHLDELITRKPIAYESTENGKNTSFLFLLGLVDAMEPIKGVMKRTDKKTVNEGDRAIDILKELKFSFTDESPKRVEITCPKHPEYLTSSWERISDGDVWLDIFSNITGIEITFNNSEINFTEESSKRIEITCPEHPEYLTSSWKRISGGDTWLDMSSNIAGIEVTFNNSRENT
ncbi:MAG: hypothetical protein LJU34_00495 [Oscillospiraceae bacterium]|nr:hypothetical protein [Oscillospiraceae bacterium]